MDETRGSQENGVSETYNLILSDHYITVYLYLGAESCVWCLNRNKCVANTQADVFYCSDHNVPRPI
jgi:hypothetical protein